MRIPHLLAVALVCAACEPFFDPELGDDEDEGEFDGIEEEPAHDGIDPLPDRPELDVELQNLRIEAVDRPDLREDLPGPVGLVVELLDDEVVEFRIDEHVVTAEIRPMAGGPDVVGFVEWDFGDGPIEAVVTADLAER